MNEFLILLRERNWHGLFQAPTSSGVVQLFRYCFVGGLSFVVDFSLFWLLLAMGIHYLICGVVAFVISFFFNFTLSRYWIFREQKRRQLWQEVVPVAVIALVGLGLTELLLWVQRDLLGFNELVAKVIAAILVLLWNFWARRVFVYRGSQGGTSEMGR